MSEKYATGDTVRLKSGGPNMTINALTIGPHMTEKYLCQWFSGTSLRQGHFPHDSLVKIESPPDLNL
jgi:uncharacterized protein YodC (DUF2158 family)